MCIGNKFWPAATFFLTAIYIIIATSFVKKCLKRAEADVPPLLVGVDKLC